MGSRAKNTFIKPGRDHVVDINVTELRQVHREPSLSNLGAEGVDGEVKSQVLYEDPKATPATSLADA